MVKAHLSTLMVTLMLGCGIAQAELTSLPERDGPPVKTTSGVPHKPFISERVPEVHQELMRRVALLPKLDIRPTVISLPGATGFWLKDGLSLKRPDVIVGGREFAHVHPDGSLHASLPPKRAFEAVDAGWADRHPWADQREGWEGFVLLFSPRTMEELDVIFGLVVDGYNFVTGAELNAEDFR